MKIHVLQHVSFEDIGAIKSWTENNNSLVTYTCLYKDEKFPDLNDFDFLIILGGPMGVYQEKEFPWLKNEKEFILSSIKAGKKVLGICLGSQLIAEVLGAKVHSNNEKEIGWFPITLSENIKEFSLFENYNDILEVFHWHGDTFTLPDEALHLASSSVCTNQAFLYKNNVLALQFHFEATEESIIKMLENEDSELEEKGSYIQDKNTILESLSNCNNSNKVLFELLNKFISL